VSTPVEAAREMNEYAERILASPDGFTVEQVAAARRLHDAFVRVRRLMSQVG
jgi:hypothetical protein